VSALVFMDTETTGLSLDADIWEFAAVRREANGDERELHLFVEHDAKKCGRLPGKFLTDHMRRFPPSHGGVEWGAGVSTRDRAAQAIYNFFSVGSGEPKPHVVGAVPNFDTERVNRMLPSWQRDPWHYHLLDVENLAVGYLCGASEIRRVFIGGEEWDALPWDSNVLSKAVGVDPEQFERHTAMGDVRWAMAIFDAVTGGAS
jgi:hypothetical protein